MTMGWRIVYFGTDWSGENRTSAQHVARWLAGRHELLFFECPGLRAPSGSSRDVRRIWTKMTAAFRAPRQPLPSVQVRTLLQLPWHQIPGIASLNRALLQFQVRRALHAAGPRRPDQPLISWFLVPHLSALAGTLGEDLTVYYCVDDFAAFPGIHPEAVRAWEAELTARSDIVFVTSATLIDRMKALTDHVVHAPHGVDVAHFERARIRPATRPSELPPTGPIIGYFGSVAEWIDLDLIQRLAERRPGWQFVLIGRPAVPIDQLPVGPNIHLLGQQPYERLPELGAWFDVAIIPYRKTRQVMHANPIKLREYLAMAKPIVTISTPEIDQFAELVTIADGTDEWETAIAAALAEPDPRERITRQITAAEAMTWDRRLLEVEAVTRAALAERAP